MIFSNESKCGTVLLLVTVFWMLSGAIRPAGASAAAPPIPFIDQQNLVGRAFGGASAPDFLLGQSFTPSLDGIDSIELNISILAFPAQCALRCSTGWSDWMASKGL